MSNENDAGQPVLAIHVAMVPALAREASVPIPLGGQTVDLPVVMVDSRHRPGATGTLKAHRNMLVGTVAGLKAHLSQAVDQLVAALVGAPEAAAASAEAVDILGARGQAIESGAILVRFDLDTPAAADDAPSTLPMPGVQPPPADGREAALATIGTILDGLVNATSLDAARVVSDEANRRIAELTQARDVCHGLLEAAQAALADERGGRADDRAQLDGEIERLRAELAAKATELDEVVRDREAAAASASASADALAALKAQVLVGDETVDELVRCVAARLPSGYRVVLQTTRPDFAVGLPAPSANAYYVIERRAFGGWRHVAEFCAKYGSWEGPSDAIARLKKDAGGLPWRTRP